jgi:hypothetical protein
MSSDQTPELATSGVRRAAEPPWNVLLIEDDSNTVRQIQEYFETREVVGRRLAFNPIIQWEDAFSLIRERKADLAILDIYRGEAAKGGERVGERVLDYFQQSGFVPVIIHTNLPEGLEGRRSEFVRLIPKTEGLGKLAEEIDALFATRVPQMNRAILNHLDRVLCDYMWGFVSREWRHLKDIADRPEFLRVLLQRLAYSFARTGVEDAVAEAYGKQDGVSLNPEKVHPAEFYLIPPFSRDPALGDIRMRKTGEKTEYLVVLWPTCDMVSSEDRMPKVDRVLCARASLLTAFPEAQDYAANGSNKNREQLRKLMANNRDTNRGSADSVHFLPAFLNIPDLVVEFRELDVLSLEDLRKLPCLGAMASPYAEQLSARFDSHRGRVGVPDLDIDHVLDKLSGSAAAKPPTTK